MTDEQLQKNAEAANTLMVQQVFVPVYLQKMASLGFPAQTDEEASDLLALAQTLENVPDNVLFGKQATAQQSPYQAALTGLYDVLGLSEKQAAVYAEQQAWQMAGDLVRQSPQLYDAALLLHALDAQQTA